MQGLVMSSKAKERRGKPEIDNTPWCSSVNEFVFGQQCRAIAA
jgi:hypothetical protein